MPPFTKMMQKIRLEQEISSKEMASILGVNPNFLSRIECGQRKIPDDFLITLFSKFEIEEKDKEEIIKACWAMRDGISLDEMSLLLDIKKKKPQAEFFNDIYKALSTCSF